MQTYSPNLSFLYKYLYIILALLQIKVSVYYYFFKHSCCYENICILEWLGKIMYHLNSLLFAHLHLRACFHHFRCKSRALTCSLNWTSNQSSSSRRRSRLPRRRFNMQTAADVSPMKADDWNTANKLADIGQRTTVGMSWPLMFLHRHQL